MSWANPPPHGFDRYDDNRYSDQRGYDISRSRSYAFEERDRGGYRGYDAPRGGFDRGYDDHRSSGYGDNYRAPGGYGQGGYSDFSRPHSERPGSISEKLSNLQNGKSFASFGERTEKAKRVPLDHNIVPSTSPDQLQQYYADNRVKILGTEPPPAALTFDELSLPGTLPDSIHQLGWTHPSAIQAITIPAALKGRDVIGIAKTGSGKTASYLLPAFTHITEQPPIMRGDGPIALILAPTRELAQQVAEVCSAFADGVSVGYACLFGGSPRGQQLEWLRQAPALVVATPGRLNDFINSGAISLDRVTFLVLDEADRMLDMGFEPQIRQIISKISKERQTLMFSATWPKEIRQLASDFLNDPVHLVIGSSELTTNSQICQLIQQVDEYDKMRACYEVVRQRPGQKALIFTKTKRTADELAEKLSRDLGLRAESIHGDKPQVRRDYILHDFKGDPHGILVATDVAARGLDVTDIDYVLNYDFPGDIESYIHRIGRTARADKSGTAISFFTPADKNLSRKLAKVMRQAGQQIPEWLQEIADGTPKDAYKYAYGYAYNYQRPPGAEYYGGFYGGYAPYGGYGGYGYGYNYPPPPAPPQGYAGQQFPPQSAQPGY